jgi:hypothetical protein
VRPEAVDCSHCGDLVHVAQLGVASGSHFQPDNMRWAPALLFHGADIASNFNVLGLPAMLCLELNVHVFQ